MQIQVTKTKVILPKDYIVNEGEYKANLLEFTFSEEYTVDLVKKAIFVNGDTAIEQAIINNTCDIPYEVLNVKSFELRVYAYEVAGSELVLRYSPTYATIYLREGSYRENTGSGEEITPTQFEQYESALNEGLNELEEGLNEVANVDIDVSKTGSTATVTITNREGTEKSVEIYDGQGGGTSNYPDLNNKPSINDVVLNGNKTLNDLGVQPAGNYLISETDPTVPSYVKNITQNDITSWNNKSNFSGSYNDLTNKPTIPSKTSNLNNDSGFIDKNVNNLTNYYKTSEIYNKTEIDNKISSVYRYMGTVATYANLPSTSLTIGDVYNVESTGDNYAWTGTTWDKLGGEIDLSEYYTKTQTDNLLEGKADTEDIPDLTDYVKNTDYAGNDNNVAGLIKVYNAYGIKIDSNGSLQARELTNEQYNSATNFALLGKGTLENVITGKQLVNQETLEESQASQDEIIAKLKADHPEIEEEGTDLSINGTGDFDLALSPNGNITQDGEPSPNNEIPVKVVDGEYEVKVENKNVFDGSFRQGTGGDLYATTRIFAQLNYYIEQGKKYTFSTDLNTNIYKFGINVSATEFPSSTLIYDSSWKTASSFTFTANVNGYLGIILGKNDNSNISPTDISTNHFQLEQNESATSYTAHAEQTQTIDTSPNPLYSANDLYFKAVNGDSFYDSLTSEQKASLESGSWYVHNEWGKVVLNGSETWALDTTYNRFSSTTTITDYDISNRTSALCSHYKYSGTPYFALSGSGNYLFFGFPNPSTTTLATWETWLSTNKPNVYYPLATPTNTPITNTTLITQLEALRNMLAYKDQTNISQTHNEAQADMIINAKTIMSMRYIESSKQDLITSSNKLNSDLVDDTNQTNKFVTSTDKTNWNAKYDKPSGGIPKTDLASNVQTSLGKADTAIQDVSGKENTSNKSDSYTASSSTTYASTKALVDGLATKQGTLTAGTNITIENNVISATGGGSGGTSNYSDLTNKPSINNVTLSGNKTTSDLGLGTITSVKMNGSTVSSSGEADLGTVITAHQNIKTINSTSLVGTGDVTVQPTLVSGTNIKTINNESLLGSGNITITGGTSTDVQINGTSIVSNGTANIITETTYNATTNKIATMSDIPSVSGKENTSNKVTSLSSSSTDTQYPSAKCVYDLIGDIESLLSEV